MKYGVIPLVILTTVIALTVVVMDSDDSSASNVNGNDGMITWTLDTDTGIMTIGGSGPMYTYNTTNDRPGWENYKNYIQHVTIGGTVRTVGQYAFYNFPNLKDVTINSTTFTTVDIGAFQNCSLLKSIDLPATTTTINASAFANCGVLDIVSRATTPPTLDSTAFQNTTINTIEVPTASISTYQSASVWSGYSSKYLPLLDSGYWVVFDAMGGTVNPTSKAVTYGQTYGELPTPVRQGYRFNGWYIPHWNDNQGGLITANSVVVIDGNKTAYADWTRVDFTVTFDPMGGTVSPSSKVVTYGQTYGELPTPTKAGYQFAGWYIPHWNDNQGGLITADSTVLIDDDKTAYADWIQTDFTVTFDPMGGTVSPSSKVVTYGQTYGELPTPIRQGYQFAGWYIPQWNDNQGGLITADTTVVIREDKTAYADWIQTDFTVTFDPMGGTVSPSSKVVTYGQTYGELPTPVRDGYVFRGWYIPHWNDNQGGLITADTTVRLNGDKTAYADWGNSTIYWSNGNPNGSVSILYHIDNTNVTNQITTYYPLYKYNPIIEDIFETEDNESFTSTGHQIKVEIGSQRTGNNDYDATVTVYLYNERNNLITSNTVDFGKWGSFIITVDTVNATVSYTKVMQFRSFTDYEESESGTILSYGSLGDYAGQVTQSLTMVGSNVTPRQSVIKTNVFLNTYGVVLTNPTLDISQYFPEMEKIRLNFYSFALLGNSMTINGHTLFVSAPNIKVYYTKVNDNYLIADGPGDNVKEKTMELSNIFITWDGERCYLTFADDNFTLNMGAYSDKLVIFDGMWYFATGLYEAYVDQETSYEVDWWGSFDYSTFGIILASMLIVGGMIAKVTIGGRTLDYVIIICGTIIALIMAGGIISA